MTTTERASMNTLGQINSVSSIAVDMPADVNQDRLADLINNTNANHTLRVELPMDTGYTNILHFAEQEGLLIRYDKMIEGPPSMIGYLISMDHHSDQQNITGSIVGLSRGTWLPSYDTAGWFDFSIRAFGDHLTIFRVAPGSDSMSRSSACGCAT